MESRRVGRSGLRVSEIGLGSWLTLGSDGGGEATRLVQAAFDLGIELFDTADVYQSGGAEEALGRATAELPRHHLVIATKCFFATSERANDRGLSRKHVVESVEASLRRLRTDYLDLHQCHRFDAATPLEETIRTYDDLVRQGKVLYWGVSDWSAEEIVAACERADAQGHCRPISNQPSYSIMRREMESEIGPVCRREGLGQLVYSPLGQGVLTGKYSAGSRPSGSRAADARKRQWMEDYLQPDALARVDQLGPIAADLGLTRAQLALAWCLRDDNVSSVIVGASRLGQLEENCKASGRALPDDVVARIDEIFPGPAPEAGA